MDIQKWIIFFNDKVAYPKDESSFLNSHNLLREHEPNLKYREMERPNPHLHHDDP